MKLFGWTIARTSEIEKQFNQVSNGRGGWFPIIRESFAGAWQQNIEIDNNQVLSHHAVFACMTLIASDLSKLRVKLVERDADGIWQEVTNPAYSPVLRKPNAIQTRVQFWENWFLSKLSNGNVYVLKVRDNRRVVTALYILDPQRVQTLVSPSGDVFYRLSSDEVSRLTRDVIVPAEEIIHDRMNCLFHPLIGVSPIVAAGLAATQGLNIQADATLFFKNLSLPSGILTAPGAISDDTAKRLKEQWQDNYGGTNAGKVAVLSDGLKFEQMRANARDSQVIEQLKWSAEVVCSVFHVPPYKIGVGPTPSYNNIQALNLEYYSQALQVLLEAAELCLDEGLGMADGIGTEFDLDGLLRMDTISQVNAVKEAVGAGIMSPNEARAKLDLRPVDGGETPWLQQQNWPIARLAERTTPTEASPNPAPNEPTEPDEDEEPEAPDQNQLALAGLVSKMAELRP